MKTLFLVLLQVSLVMPEKRIILHSGTDLADAFHSLKSELDAFKANMSHFDTEVRMLTAKLSSLEKENADLRNQLKGKSDHSSVFVHWGRTICPGNATEIIYTGYTAGGHYKDQGGGGNLLCLPDHPTWGNYSNGLDLLRGYIYGVEIDIYEPGQSRIFDHVVNEQDQPCTVCRTQFSVTQMFPGRANCFPGWSLQYTGYLMSSYHANHLNLDYICGDSDPGALAGGGTNDNQGIIYLVEARCGSLPCPPYVDGREIACAVCSK